MMHGQHGQDVGAELEKGSPLSECLSTGSTFETRTDCPPRTKKHPKHKRSWVNLLTVGTRGPALAKFPGLWMGGGGGEARRK